MDALCAGSDHKLCSSQKEAVGYKTNIYQKVSARQLFLIKVVASGSREHIYKWNNQTASQ